MSADDRGCLQCPTGAAVSLPNRYRLRTDVCGRVVKTSRLGDPGSNTHDRPPDGEARCDHAPGHSTRLCPRGVRGSTTVGLAELPTDDTSESLGPRADAGLHLERMTSFSFDPTR